MKTNLKIVLRQVKKDTEKYKLIKGLFREIISCKEEWEHNVQTRGKGKPNYIIPKVQVDEYDGSFIFSYIFDDVHVIFTIEKDINDSHWSLKTKEKYGNIKAVGKIMWDIHYHENWGYSSWATINQGLINYVMGFIMCANDWKEKDK